MLQLWKEPTSQTQDDKIVMAPSSFGTQPEVTKHA